MLKATVVAGYPSVVLGQEDKQNPHHPGEEMGFFVCGVSGFEWSERGTEMLKLTWLPAKNK